MGGSNGGLLTSVMLTQRPELFGAVVSKVPLTDMQRFHKLLAGASWMSEYGDPDKPEDWAALSQFSPLHNIKKAFVVSAGRSTRRRRKTTAFIPVTRGRWSRSSRRWAHKPLYYENIEGGHGGAADIKQRAYVDALVYTFLGRASPRNSAHEAGGGRRVRSEMFDHHVVHQRLVFAYRSLEATSDSESVVRADLFGGQGDRRVPIHGRGDVGLSIARPHLEPQAYPLTDGEAGLGDLLLRRALEPWRVGHEDEDRLAEQEADLQIHGAPFVDSQAGDCRHGRDHGRGGLGDRDVEREAAHTWMRELLEERGLAAGSGSGGLDLERVRLGRGAFVDDADAARRDLRAAPDSGTAFIE